VESRRFRDASAVMRRLLICGCWGFVDNREVVLVMVSGV